MRVVALSAAASLLLGLALVLLIVAVTSQRDAARTAFNSQETVAAGRELENSLITIENGLRGYVASGQQRLLDPVTQALRRYPARRRALEKLVIDDPVQRRRVALINNDIQSYTDFWVEPLIGLARDARRRARSALRNDEERLNPVRRDLAALFARERSVIAERTDRAESRSSRAITFGLGGLLLVFAISIGFTLYLRRSIVRPVLAVAEATGRLAAGDHDTRVPAGREDELGVLADGFNAMADSLTRGRAELERSNSELTRSNAELEQFASVTSHDLQAPLTTISMYTELLERRRTTPRTDEPDLVDGIREATQQARALIRDLLEYSRAGRGALSAEEIPAATIVEDALERLAGAIEETGARIEVGPLPVVLADRGNLCRVFQNLVGNAMKFNRDGSPVVSIEADRDGDLWRFSVRDNGIGMKPEHTQRIFEPFQRLHGEEDYAGTGIGLAVCERIIAQHGGSIWVSSVPGEGSVFQFTVPGAERQVRVQDERPAAAARAGG